MSLIFISVDVKGTLSSIFDMNYEVIVPTSTTVIEDLDPNVFLKDFEKELTHLIREDSSVKRRIKNTNYRRFTVSIKKTYPEIPFLIS